MSVASEITRLQNAKASLKTSINAKTDAQHQINNETLDEYAGFVDSITTGGGTEGWQRPNDWWDTETILANAEPIGSSYPLMIFLISDSSPTTTFYKYSNLYFKIEYNAIVTSDGAYYTENGVTHTWDTTKDKPCSLGYKTRYFIVYGSKNTSMNDMYLYFPFLELITNADTRVYSLRVGNTNTSYVNREVMNVKFQGTIASSDFMFQNCSALKKVELTKPSTIPDSCFKGCSVLTDVSLPNATTINASAFQSCSALEKITLPKATRLNTSTFNGCSSLENVSIPLLSNIAGSGSTFNGCRSLKSLTLPSTIANVSNLVSNCYTLYNLILPVDFDITGLTLSSCNCLTPNSLNNILSKLKDNTGTENTRTLTLGATNLAKLTAEEIAVGTNKGWTIN